MIAVCVKWVEAPDEPGDERFAGISDADQAALELALCQATENPSQRTEVVVVTAGPEAAEQALRDAIACGADRAVRVDVPSASPSAAVAAELAVVVAEADFVWCGDLSVDRGSGSVPAFLAAHLGAAQALGAVAVAIGAMADDDAAAGRIVTRRLDGGRREVVRIGARAVISVEGAAARLRRAGLGALLAARAAPIEVRSAATGPHPETPTSARPYRPRPRALAPPSGTTLQRLRELTDVSGAPTHGETVHLDPVAAADRIVVVLRDWGYLNG